MDTYTTRALIGKVRGRLHDPQFSEDDILDFLNSEQRAVLGESEWPFLESVNITEETESGELPLPENYQVTLRATAQTSDNHRKTFIYVPFREYFSNNLPRAYIYTTFGGNFLFTLPKNTSTTSWTIKHYFLSKPPVMTLESAPVIPEEYSEILILGALERAERRRDNFDFAAVYKSEKLELTENMKLRFGPSQDQVDIGGVPFHAQVKNY